MKEFKEKISLLLNAEQGNAQFLNDGDILKEGTINLSKFEERKQERQDRFMKALEEAIEKEPQYNIYKNGKISLNYDKDYDCLYFSFSLKEKDKKERVELFWYRTISIMNQIIAMRECTFRNINNMIYSLEYGENDFHRNYYNVRWNFRKEEIIEVGYFDLMNCYHHSLDIEPSATLWYFGTKEAYSDLYKWKVLMIAYDRLLKWIADNEDTISKYEKLKANI